MNEHDPSQQFNKEQAKDQNPQQATDLFHHESDLLKAHVKSPYLRHYQKFLQETKQSFNIIDYKQQLQRHRITYTPNRFTNQPTITFLSETKNKQIICLSVSLSYFNFELHLLNLQEFSPTQQQLSCLGFGSMGTTYCYSVQNGLRFVIKAIHYNTKQLITHEISSKLLQSTILQCCYTKLFSALQIGPAFLNTFGFDLLVFKQRVEFMLQFCEKININTELFNLYQSLKIMHSFRIIHGDIKPQNIMWSYQFNKLVFIDFGLTKIVKENVGELTVSKYFGSYLFSIKEMQDLFFNKSVGYIDLYYNDVHTLLMSQKLNKKEENEKPKKKLKPKTYTQFYQTHMQNICLVYYIFTKNFQNIKQCINMKKPKMLMNITLQIFIELPASQSLTKIKNGLSKKFNFPKQITEQMQQNIKNTGKLGNKNKNKRVVFTHRVKQISNSNMIPLHNTMIIIKIFFDQDISANGLNHKKILQESLKKIVLHDDAKQFNPQFWNKFLKYTQNLFSQKQDVQNMLSIAIKYLGLEFNTLEENQLFSKKISHKSEEEKSYFYIYLKAWKIVQVVKQKYGINLSELNMENNVNKGTNKLRYYLQYFDKNIEKYRKQIQTFPYPISIYTSIFQIMQGYNKNSNQNVYLQKIKNYKLSQTNQQKQSGIIIIYQFIEFLLLIENQHHITNSKCQHFYQQFIHHGIINKSKLTKYTYQILYFSEHEQSQSKLILFNNISNQIFYNYCFETNQLIEFLLQNVTIQQIYNLSIINTTQFKQNLTNILKFILLLKHNFDAINKINHFIFNILNDLKLKLISLQSNNQLNYYLHQKIKNSIIQCISFSIQKLLQISQHIMHNNIFINTLISIIGVIPQYFNHIENVQQFNNNIIPQMKTILNSIQSFLQNSSIPPHQQYITLISKYDAQYKMKIITPQQLYSSLKNIENCQKYKQINKFQIYIFYAFLSQIIQINLFQIDHKLINQQISSCNLFKMFISTPYLSLLLTYNKNKQNQQNMLTVIQRIIQLNQLKPINHSQINYISFHYYHIAIHNLLIYSEGPQRLSISINNIINLFQNLAQTHQQQYIHKLSNTLPIFQALMIISTHLPEDSSHLNVFELASKFVKVLKYVHILLPFSNPFYARRIKNLLELFILNLADKNIPILQFWRTAPPEIYVRNESLEEWIQVKKIRSQQYPLYQSQIDSIVALIQTKNEIKYQNQYDKNILKMKKMVNIISQKIGQKLNNINYNKNLQIIYQNQMKIQSKLIGKYIQYLNQKEIIIQL